MALTLDEAIQAARIVALKINQPVLVVQLAGDNFMVKTAGAINGHVATVYASGSVDTECLKTRWFRFRRCLCE